MKLEKIFTENKKKIKKDVTDSESNVFTENTSDTTSSENTESSNTSISNKDNIECNEIDIFSSKKFDVNKKLESLSKKKSETSTTIEFEKFINNRKNNVSNAKIAHSASKSLVDEVLKNINLKKKSNNKCKFDELNVCDDDSSDCSDSPCSSSSLCSSDCNIFKLIIKFLKILICEIYKLLVIFWKYFKIIVIFFSIKIIIFIKWLIKLCHEHCNSSSSSKCKSSSSKSNIICTTVLCKKPFDNNKDNKNKSVNKFRSKSCSKINYNKCIDLSEELKTIKKNNDTDSDVSIFLNKKDYEKWVNNNKKQNKGLIKQEIYVNNEKKFSKNNSKQKSKNHSRPISKKRSKHSSKKFVYESSNDLNNSNVECNTPILNEIFNTMNYKI